METMGLVAVPRRRAVPYLPIVFLIVAGLLIVAPFGLSDFRLSLLAKFLCFAIVAVGLDLAWGFTGMMSLGHAVFFGFGAYAFAMYLKLEAAGTGLPDFMAWSGLKELPWFWLPFQSAVFALAMAVIVPALLGGLLAYFLSRGRTQGVYFSIITQALALIVTTLIVGQQAYTGGTNGMTNFSTMFGWSLQDVAVQRGLYWATLAALGLALGLGYFVTRSRFGRLLVAVRDDEARLRFRGYDPAIIKVVVFALSTGLAGLAGALFVPQVGIISPAMMGIVPSIEMVIWVAVGGRGTLVGPVLGALVVNAAKSSFSESFPDIWQYFLGALFIIVVMLFPAGIAGSVPVIADRIRLRWTARSLGTGPSGGIGSRPAAAVYVHGEEAG